MHLIFENLIPNLVSLWTGKFKDFPPSDDFVFSPPSIWDAITEASHQSSKTIPSAYGAPVPNIKTQRSHMTAETWSFWAIFVGPVVLRRRFKRKVFYDHFITLVKLIRTCLKLEYTAQDIEDIDSGFNAWVQEFERLYYKGDPSRLSCCTLALHALLHIAHDIRQAGPVWVYWAFAMERYCGRLQSAIKSRRFPWSNLDHFIEIDSLLSLVKYNHHLDIGDTLDISPQSHHGRRVMEKRNTAYPDYTLHSPSEVRAITKSQQTNIARHLSTRYGIALSVARRVIPMTLEHWGKLRISNGGDLIHAHHVVKRPRDGRDASFVRYEDWVDRHARNHRADPDFVAKDFWGQLLNIFVLNIDDSGAYLLGEHSSRRTFFLTEVRRCKIVSKDVLGNMYYREMGTVDVVDLESIQCVVGRIYDRKEWAIVDRSDPLAHASFHVSSQ
ncbi:hypothetical protein BD311DRAFT_786599 [Dichomitus squalens]|uniref:Uncharacterized protein n=1 Tax=Dichomitus squalens TaxID=114155 RepID=A0A4V6MW07_9APHY|nr:hypothetical protein BD311DRAFT_786599 [Dichomitus squalens]